MPNTPFRQAQTVRARRKTRAERRKHFFRDILKGVEQLEDRSLLASVVWDGGAGTFNWNDADNWEPNGVPTAADDVTIGTRPSDRRERAPAARWFLPNGFRFRPYRWISGASAGIDLAGGTLSINGLSPSVATAWSAGTVNGSGTANAVPVAEWKSWARRR
jgi:hypothetical protein